ncbi:hypothetical protein [Mycolicibacterium vaccae]|uniref:hypothetical protein n=1 Tax=Mycolicibacterium vaccae TaxID=1810 RepID=UPI003D059B14
MVVATGSLAVAQFYFLPNNLGATEFGYVVLGISVIQAGLQLADLGMVNASLRSDVAADLRESMRVNAVAVASIICVIGIVGCSIVAMLRGSTSPLIVAAALACALWLVGHRADASAAAQCGDEQRTTRHNVIWQNAPKIGSIGGSFGGTALLALVGALATSILSSRPRMPRMPDWLLLRSSHRLWLPGLAVALSAFLLSWTETYVLTIFAGVDEAGQYQAVVRPLTGITYLYLPIVAMIQAAHNVAARRRVFLLTGAGLGIGALGSGGVALFLVLAGRRIWPEFDFDSTVVAGAAVACAAMCASTVIGTRLVVRGYHVIASCNAVFGAVVLIVVSLLTVDSLGARGAALASACAWTSVVLCHMGHLMVVGRRQRGA